MRYFNRKQITKKLRINLSCSVRNFLLSIFNQNCSHYNFRIVLVDLISVGKARECRMESDCAGIQNTTCLADQRDGRTRCLCGDYNAPVNGACTNKYKGKILLRIINDIDLINKKYIYVSIKI